MNTIDNKNVAQNNSITILNSIELRKKHSKQILIKNLTKTLLFSVLLLSFCFFSCKLISINDIPNYLFVIAALISSSIAGLLVVFAATADVKSQDIKTIGSILAGIFYISVFVGFPGFLFSDGLLAKYFILAPILSSALLFLFLFGGGFFYDLVKAYKDYKRSKHIEFKTVYSHRGSSHYTYVKLQTLNFEEAKLLSDIKFKERYPNKAELLETGEISSETTWYNY
jgi:hypothetical protein